MEQFSGTHIYETKQKRGRKSPLGDQVAYTAAGRLHSCNTQHHHSLAPQTLSWTCYPQGEGTRKKGVETIQTELVSWPLADFLTAMSDIPEEKREPCKRIHPLLSTSYGSKPMSTKHLYRCNAILTDYLSVSIQFLKYLPYMKHVFTYSLCSHAFSHFIIIQQILLQSTLKPGI